MLSLGKDPGSESQGKCGAHLVYFSSRKDHRLKLSVCQCLKKGASNIASSVIFVNGGKINLMIISVMDGTLRPLLEVPFPK